MKYRVFDLATSKYITRDGTPGCVLVTWAGIFSEGELEMLLAKRYGTIDRVEVSRRATIILVK